MTSDTPKKELPTDGDETASPKTPVDEKAQEDAAKVREESGGYD